MNILMEIKCTAPVHRTTQGMLLFIELSEFRAVNYLQ